MKIGNIVIDKKIIMYIIIIFVIVTGFVGYSYINSDLNSTATLSLNKYNCNQENLYDRLSCMATMDNIKSKYVSSNMGIDFSNISSDTNGKGLYTLSSTKGDTYPIHYYRGDVSDNNVKLGNYCWLIVRTTDTGGTKLVYNGEIDANGKCTANGNDATIGSSRWVANTTGIGYGGYMIKTYKYFYEKTLSSDYYYGNSYSFSNNKYILDNYSQDINNLSDNHYSCFSSDTECSEMFYIYQINDDKAYCFKITNNEDVTDLFNIVNTNESNSDIKTYIEDWFEQNLSGNSSMIEDTIYCNDRSYLNGNYADTSWNKDNGIVDQSLYFGYLGRKYKNLNPTLKCDTNDSFTVSSEIGNGKLKYPIALLSNDEIVFSGGGIDLANNNYFLYLNVNWWTLSPNSINNHIVRNSVVNFYGGLQGDFLYNSWRVRPSISLNHNIVVTSGDGSSDNPYVVSFPYMPNQLTTKYSNRYVMSYNEETMTNNITISTGGGWEQIIKPLNVSKGKRYRISFECNLLTDYNPLSSSYDGIAYQVVNISSSQLSDQDNSLANYLLTQQYMRTTIGSETINLEFVAGEENYFVINGGSAADSQTINFEISDYYVQEID